MKTRLDKLLVERGLTSSRERAQALILAGKVLVNEQKIEKAGASVDSGSVLRLLGEELRYVSRGGLKLEKALEHWQIDLRDKICLDIGASTGGFTDVLLHHGAAHVHAVDVGHGQLAWKLRTDPRVTVYEKTNARHLTAEIIPPPVDAIVCDASFIGLQTVLPAGLSLCGKGAFAVALIKPQFEAGPEHVGKGGVVRDPAVHDAVCARIETWWSGLENWRVLGITPSPITGPEGNREFLIAALKQA